MPYALINVSPLQLLDGPWGAIPDKLKFPNNIVALAPQPGEEHDGVRLVDVVVVSNPPSRYHTKSGQTYDLVGNTLTVTHTFIRTDDPSVGKVKLEAERRIFARFPIDKQLNAYSDFMLMREHIAGGGSLTTAQQTRYDQIKGAWAWIKSVRDTSDTIEAMTPIPDDYDDDARWPA